MGFLTPLLTKYTVIKDALGNLWPQRSKLQFLNATVTDDPVNDATVVTPTGGGGGSGGGQVAASLAGIALSGTFTFTQNSLTVNTSANQTGTLFPGDAIYAASSNTPFWVASVGASSIKISDYWPNATVTTSATSSRNSNIASAGQYLIRLGLAGGAPQGPFSIGGFSTTLQSLAGIPLTVVNTTAFQCTILNADPLSSSANRISTLSGNSGPVVLKASGGSATFVYDTTFGGWQQISAGWLDQSPVRRDPRDFGAVGDGVTDDTAALQAWLDSVTSRGPENFLPETDIKTVVYGGLFQASLYHITQPLVINDYYPTFELSPFGNQATRLRGAGKTRVGLDALSFVGQPILNGNFSGRPQYFQESNGVYTVNGSSAFGAYLTLSEYWHGDIGGLGAMSFTMWWNPADSPASSQYTLCESSGNDGAVTHLAFNITRSFVSTGITRIAAQLNTTGGVLTAAAANGTDLTLNTCQQIRATFDGLTLRLFVGGTFVAASSTLGSAATIIQHWSEEFVVGNSGFLSWPSSNGFGHTGGTNYTFGLVRLDKVCLNNTNSNYSPNITADRTGTSLQTMYLADMAPVAVDGITATRPTRQSLSDFIIAHSWTSAPVGTTILNWPVWSRFHTQAWSGSSYFFPYTKYTEISDLFIQSWGGEIQYRSSLQCNCHSIISSGGSRGIVVIDFSYATQIGPDIEFNTKNGQQTGVSANISSIYGCQFLTIAQNVTSNGGSCNWHIIIADADATIHGGGFLNGFRQGVLACCAAATSVKTIGFSFTDEGSSGLGFCGIFLSSGQLDADINLGFIAISSAPVVVAFNYTSARIVGCIINNGVGTSKATFAGGPTRGASTPIIVKGLLTNPNGAPIVDPNNPVPIILEDAPPYIYNVTSDADQTLPDAGVHAPVIELRDQNGIWQSDHNVIVPDALRGTNTRRLINRMYNGHGFYLKKAGGLGAYVPNNAIVSAAPNGTDWEGSSSVASTPPALAPLVGAAVDYWYRTEGITQIGYGTPPFTATTWKDTIKAFSLTGGGGLNYYPTGTYGPYASFSGLSSTQVVHANSATVSTGSGVFMWAVLDQTGTTFNVQGCLYYYDGTHEVSIQANGGQYQMKGNGSTPKWASGTQSTIQFVWGYTDGASTGTAYTMIGVGGAAPVVSTAAAAYLMPGSAQLGIGGSAGGILYAGQGYEFGIATGVTSTTASTLAASLYTYAKAAYPVT